MMTVTKKICHGLFTIHLIKLVLWPIHQIGASQFKYYDVHQGTQKQPSDQFTISAAPMANITDHFLHFLLFFQPELGPAVGTTPLHQE